MTPLLIEFIESCAAVEAEPYVVGEMLAANPEAAKEYNALMQALQSNLVATTAGPLYILPILTATACADLIGLAKGFDFAPNLTEGSEYQIHEAVLAEVAPELDRQLKVELGRIINAYSLMLYSRPLIEFSSLQMAKYSPDGTPGTGWHHDVTSDLSLVISLNPGAFEGGGTGVRQTAHQFVQVPPLPAGWAMLFDGKAIQHKGEVVTAGERLLLVAWCKTGSAK